MIVADGLKVAGDAGVEFWPNDGVFGKGVVVWRSPGVVGDEVIVCWISVGVFGKKINATESVCGTRFCRLHKPRSDLCV